MSGDGSLWIVLPTGQQAAGGWIDDTLKQRAAEQGLSAKVPLAADFDALTRKVGGERDLG